jgi:hypothetical protein
LPELGDPATRSKAVSKRWDEGDSQLSAVPGDVGRAAAFGWAEPPQEASGCREDALPVVGYGKLEL